MASVSVGGTASGFTLKDASEKLVSFSDFNGKWVVLYFYPKDNTPGCTIEAMDFSALKKEFEAEGAVILGISRDSCKSHQRFIDSKGLTIILLSDPDAVVAKAYGVLRQKKFMGETFMGVARTTFLVGPDGVVANVWDDVNVLGHAKDVLSVLGRLKSSRKT